jgi:hypothetical protein
MTSLTAYLQDPRYASQKDATSLLPLIGTLSSGIIYCSGSFRRLIMVKQSKFQQDRLLIPSLLVTLTIVASRCGLEQFCVAGLSSEQATQLKLVFN